MSTLSIKDLKRMDERPERAHEFLKAHPGAFTLMDNFARLEGRVYCDLEGEHLERVLPGPDKLKWQYIRYTLAGLALSLMPTAVGVGLVVTWIVGQNPVFHLGIVLLLAVSYQGNVLAKPVLREIKIIAGIVETSMLCASILTKARVYRLIRRSQEVSK